MRYLALERGIGRLEADGSVAVLDADMSLAQHLASGGRLGGLETIGVIRRCELRDAPLGSLAGTTTSIWGIGLNYRSKQVATGRSLPDFPTLFLKAPSAIAAPGEPISLPSAAPDCVDYEGEIAVVVGERLFEATEQQAASAVSAITAANDVTARDVLRNTGSPSLAKSFPSFCQLGSAAVDPAVLGGIGAVELTTRVNGDLRQSDRGNGLLMGVGELLALISKHAVLSPGDIVLTGSPAGTGDETASYLAPGDVVEVTIADLPALRSEVVGARAVVLGATSQMGV